MKENRKLLKEVIEDIQRDLKDEEVLKLLAGSKISVNPSKDREKYTFGQKAADAIAKFAGSWAFIFSFVGVMRCGNPGAAYYDEPEPPGGKRSPPRGK